MGFGSNKEPKFFGKKMLSKDDWYCYSCEQENKYYLGKCPSCGSRRGQDDSYRKGGK